MDAESEALARGSVQQALVRAPDDIGAALADFGWTELVENDQAFAFTTLFEEQGYLALDTDALDVVTIAALDVDAPASVIWPRFVTGSEGSRQGGELTVDGVALRSVRTAGATVLAPAAGALQVLDVSAIDEAPLGGMASGTRWMRVRVSGTSRRAQGSWPEIERRSRLATASELVGLARRIIDVATEHVTTRRQFGRPIGTYQAVRHRVAEAYADMAGAKALVAAAWEDGRRRRRRSHERLPDPRMTRWPSTPSRSAARSASRMSTSCLGSCGAAWPSTRCSLPRRRNMCRSGGRCWNARRWSQWGASEARGKCGRPLTDRGTVRGRWFRGRTRMNPADISAAA